MGKRFGSTEVLRDINFSLEEGETLAVIGSSGSGKTTLLRCLNFLERPDAGCMILRGETLFDSEAQNRYDEQSIRLKRLHFGLVFQSFNLFPQYTALENVVLARELAARKQPEYKKNKKNILTKTHREDMELLEQIGLASNEPPARKRLDYKKNKKTRLTKTHREDMEPLEQIGLASDELSARKQLEYKKNKKTILTEIHREGMELLEQIGLASKHDFYPHQLSGGQQQRVAIARALALKPDILCFDEPTSALDPELTGEVLNVIRGLSKKNTTMIIVTHEMQFASQVADTILFMDEGLVVEYGTPQDVLENPSNERTKRFLERYS
ncbi:MAG: amino acid ABC transporter ATP-binding protein [Peptococcaceae bacterium]|nr:amino acid ABC transporter ATP-binding protein [Peptococcaceae bacterium]